MQDRIKIHRAASDKQINACYSLMNDLRPHITQHEFLNRVRMQEEQGYQMAFIEEGPDIIALAGFRVNENLAWGRFLYVDDLVTLETHRSMGYGAALLIWLEGYARTNGVTQIHLDSAFQREDAHRFYERVGMSKTGFHFARILADQPG